MGTRTSHVACEHCHAELKPSDIAKQGADTHRCRLCGGRALRNREAAASVYDAG